jgi:hypothetical protein
MRADADAFVRHLHTKVAADRRREVASIHAEVWGGAAPPPRAAAPPPPRAAAPPPPRAAAPPPPVEEAVPTGPAATAEAAVTAEAETAETIALRDIAFDYLADHPDGARLTDMEREFGMARIQIARALRGLIDDNKVEKRELVYFAI